VDSNLVLPMGDTSLLQWSHDAIDKLAIIIPIIMWVIWCARNKKLFEDCNSSIHGLLAKVHSLHMDVLRAYGSPTQSSPSKAPQDVVWPKGHIGSIILNVGGSALTNPGVAGFGGLIRDHNGKFIKGYYGSTGYILHAEIMALLFSSVGKQGSKT
jgi:hypothetical protein